MPSAPGARSFATSIIYPPPEVFIGEKAPDWEGNAVVDNEITEIALKDYKGKWLIMLFYPKDFTFVCPTELIAFSDRSKDFAAYNATVVGVSTDTEETHLAWCKTPRKRGGLGHMQIPLLSDATKEISARYGVLIPKLGVALRGLFIINPEQEVEQVTINSLPVGRSVDEALRLLGAIQFVREHGEVCPADWKPGSATMKADPEKSLEYFSKQEDASTTSDDRVLELKTPKDFNKFIAQSGPVVVDFYAAWCGKCAMIAPHVAELAEKYPDVKFAKVDTAEEQFSGLASDLGVHSLPTFKFYMDGKEVLPEVVGYKKRPLDESVKRLLHCRDNPSDCP